MFRLISWREKAAEVYKRVVTTAAESVNSYNRIIDPAGSPEKIKTRIKLAGVFAEVSIMALLMRNGLRIREKPDEMDYFALMSHLTADHANIGGNSVEKAWDVDVITDVGSGCLSYPYKVQVKSSQNANRLSGRTDSSEISKVILRPDLQADPKERLSVTTIINECSYVESSQGNTHRINAQLNQRTEKLLDILG